MTTQSLPSFLLPTTQMKRGPQRAPVPRKVDLSSLVSAWSDRLEAGALSDDVGQHTAPFTPPNDASVLPHASSDLDIGGGAAVSTQKIVANVSMIGQGHSNWCWAAVTQSVQDWAGQPAEQQDIATAHVQASGRPYSCAPPNSATTLGRNCAPSHQCQGSCNDQHILSVVLGESGRLRQAQQVTSTFAQFTALLNAESPVPCRVRWSAQAGHFIMVFGWTIDASGNQKVHVLDPATAAAGAPVSPRIWLIADFVAHYSVSGPSGTINYIYEVQ